MRGEIIMFSPKFFKALKTSRGIILWIVLVLCLALSLLALKAEQLALYHHNQVRLIKIFSEKINSTRGTRS
jgi:hypothetical protein